MKQRMFYTGYSIRVTDTFGTRTVNGNMGLLFAADCKKDMQMMATAKDFIGNRFEVPADDVTIVLFIEMEV